ncbi:MAG: hypothetical protein CMH08_11565 [Marinovum sp.]|nr:hypothetical protein [Marinovum sp.]
MFDFCWQNALSCEVDNLFSSVAPLDICKSLLVCLKFSLGTVQKLQNVNDILMNSAALRREPEKILIL